MRLAKMTALQFQRFGEGKAPSEEEKQALQTARSLLVEHVIKDLEQRLAPLDSSQAKAAAADPQDELLLFEALRLLLQVAIQAEDVQEGEKLFKRIAEMKPEETKILQSERARLNQMEKSVVVKKGSGTVEELQLELRENVEK